MSLELMGLIAGAIGLALIGAPIYWTALFMAVSTVFGATAALSLPALGGASVLVPNLFLVFFILRVFKTAGESPVFASMVPFRPGFWLLLLTVFGLLSAFFLPRLFAGMTDTMSVTRTLGARNFISLLPLRPTSTNITQSVYAFGGLLCFAFAFAYGRRAGTAKQVMTIFLIVGAVDVGFAILDVVTFYTGTGYLMDFTRTANYGLLTGSEKGGLKRISGTFSEASAFADYSLALFAVAGSLWLDKTRNRAAGFVAFALLIALVLSTSATALVGIAMLGTFLGIRSLYSSLTKPSRSRPGFLVFGGFFMLLVVLAIPIFLPGVANDVQAFLDEILFSKVESQSGRERFQWNASAYQTFVDTMGIGAGLGSARASSFALVLLSNVGVFGTLLFVLFAWSVLSAETGWRSARTEAELDNARIARATKAGFLSVILTSLISGTVYDLGLLIYMLGGLSSAFCLGQVKKPIELPNFLSRPNPPIYADHLAAKGQAR